MSLRQSLDNASLRLLERLHLADFFEDRNIPPVVFPIVILVLVLLITAFLFAPHQTILPSSGCGDGVCEASTGEDSISCSQDCPSFQEQLFLVTVRIEGRVLNEIEVKLEDSDGAVIKSSLGALNQFSFAGISAGRIKATLLNPRNSKTTESTYIPVGKGSNNIIISLPSGFFEETDSPKASIRVQVLDSATSSSISAKVTLIEVHGSSYTILETKPISGSVSFTVDANLWYGVIAEADGYETFETKNRPVMGQQGQEREIIALMKPIELPLPQASLRVCAVDQNGKSVSGSVELSDLLQEEIGERVFSNGCTDFELNAQTVFINLKGLPGGCISNIIEKQLGVGENSVTVPVHCGGIARARVKLLSENGTILTPLANITALYGDGTKIPGSQPNRNLAVGQNGYSEYISLLPSAPFYFHVYGLKDYYVYDSEKFILNNNENRSIQLILKKAQPGYALSFGNILFPNYVAPGTIFSVSVGRIVYGQTIVSTKANLSFSIAGRSCNASGLSAICKAPDEPGVYDLAIVADYLGRTGSLTKNLTVLASGEQGLFTIVPYPNSDDEPPVTFEFDIKFNGTPLISPDDSKVQVFYGSGNVVVGPVLLQGSNGYYSMIVDSPFPGVHRAEMYLMKVSNGGMYKQNYTLSFDSHPASLKLTQRSSVSPKIVEPNNAFNIYASLKHGINEVQGLTNVYATLFNEKRPLKWSGSLHSYTDSFVAPPREGIYEIRLDLGYQQIAEQKVYVINTSKSKSSECRIESCGSIPEVRKCVYRHKTERMYSESDVVECIERGWTVSGTSIVHCESSSANRGDWDDNCNLTSADVAIMSDILTKIPDQTERNAYSACGDMDNDGDVDANDKTCLSKVVSGTWDGDKGDSACSSQLKGGFCFDIAKDMAGDYNDDGKLDVQDLSILQNIVAVSDAGVAPSLKILDVSDFDGNGVIDNSDISCFESIIGQGKITPSCLSVYNFGCIGTPGDLTQDGVYDEVDLIIESWIMSNRIDVYTDPEAVQAYSCADSNDDGNLTREDYECLSAMVNNDLTDMQLFCNPCQLQRKRDGRYGQEICHDGVDNDCDGKTDSADPRCSCGPQTPCSMLYDENGVISNTGSDSYLLCRAFGERNFGDTENGNRVLDIDDAIELKEDDLVWGWYTLSAIRANCNGDSDWGDTLSCGGSTATCLYKYQAGDSMNPALAQERIGEAYDYEDVGKKLFEWFLASANIGPIGVVDNCTPRGTYPVCSDGWHQVATSTNSAHCKCTYCRFDYDVCGGVGCEGESGSGIDLSSCNDTYYLYTEACPAKHTCLGTIDESTEGLGRFDRTSYPGFTWIPTSDGADGMLRVIVPNSNSGAAPSKVYIAKDPLAHFGVVEEGISLGGNQYKFSKTGIEYGACYLIAEYSDNTKKAYWIKSGATWYYAGGTVRF